MDLSSPSDDEIVETKIVFKDVTCETCSWNTKNVNKARRVTGLNIQKKYRKEITLDEVPDISKWLAPSST